MCACEPGFTCRRCEGTPFDPAYLDVEPPPLTLAEWDALTRETTREPLIFEAR